MLVIKKIRTDHNITQKQLAEKTGLNIRWIQKVENGETKIENITVLNMMKLFKGLSELTEDDKLIDDFRIIREAYCVISGSVGDF